jgi:hypothetical protein
MIFYEKREDKEKCERKRRKRKDKGKIKDKKGKRAEGGKIRIRIPELRITTCIMPAVLA